MQVATLQVEKKIAKQAVIMPILKVAVARAHPKPTISKILTMVYSDRWEKQLAILSRDSQMWKFRKYMKNWERQQHKNWSMHCLRW